MKKDEFLKIVRSKMKADPTPEELAYFESMGEAIERAFSAEGVERKKQIEDLTAMVGSVEQGKSIAEVIRGLATEVHNLKENAKRGLSANEKFALRKMLNEKKDDILAARGTNSVWAIEFRAKRAAAMMTTGSILAGATPFNTLSVEDDLEVLVIKYPKNFIIDAIGGRQVGKVPEYRKWKEQTPTDTDGVVTSVAEGTQKPLVDRKFVWKSSQRKKYAGRIEFTEELTMDFDQLLLQVIDMFEEQVIRAWNDDIQTQILAWAPAYTTTGLDGFYIAPGIAQVIEAGKLHVADNNYMADMVMINPTDAAKAMVHQSKDGVITYLPADMAFGGLTPFVSNKVPVGTIAIGTSGVVKEQHSSFTVRRGVYGDQFIENEETIVGEVFSNLSLPTINQKSWVKLNVDTVLTQLTKIVA